MSDQTKAGALIRHLTEAGPHVFRWGTRTYVMAILNVTPDSFSGDGVGASVGAAIDRAAWAVGAGADILDVGGESTRPGSEPVAPDEELDRVIPAIEALSSRFEVAISIDTYKARVAQAALDAGAHIVNDVWGLRVDAEMAPLVALRDVPVIVMHNRSDPRRVAGDNVVGSWYAGSEYSDLVADVTNELMESVQIARRAGVNDAKIVVDPGIGFGKSVEQNLRLIDAVGAVRALGYPVLIGPSRKSFIGQTLELPPGQRVEGTAAAVAVGIARGADIIRVHDVGFMTRVARMADAIVRAGGVS